MGCQAMTGLEALEGSPCGLVFWCFVRGSIARMRGAVQRSGIRLE